MKKKKLFITTTVARTLYFFCGQPRLWTESFEVTAIASEHENLVAFTQEEGIKAIFMPMHREISFCSDLFCLFRWIWLLLKERPYIVHGNTPKASLLSMVAAWLTRRPVRIYMCHGLRYQGTQGKLRKLLMLLEKVSCSCATHVYCVSKGVADVLVEDSLCKKEKINVIGYGSAGGVDVERFKPESVKSCIRRNLGIPDNAFVFTFVGRIVKDKGINELVSAFERISLDYNSVYLLLVGSVETVQNPISVASSSLIESHPRILAVGPQADVRPFLKASTALILPSYREGFGMVLIEAGAMGLPCIATNITGCNEIIIPEENGAIVEPRNIDALYNVMKEWIENPTLLLNMAKNARKMVKERYDCHKVWQLYYDEYKRL